MINSYRWHFPLIVNKYSVHLWSVQSYIKNLNKIYWFLVKAKSRRCQTGRKAALRKEIHSGQLVLEGGWGTVRERRRPSVQRSASTIWPNIKRSFSGGLRWFSSPCPGPRWCARCTSCHCRTCWDSSCCWRSLTPQTDPEDSHSPSLSLKRVWRGRRLVTDGISPILTAALTLWGATDEHVSMLAFPITTHLVCADRKRINLTNSRDVCWLITLFGTRVDERHGHYNNIMREAELTNQWVTIEKRGIRQEDFSLTFKRKLVKSICLSGNSKVKGIYPLGIMLGFFFCIWMKYLGHTALREEELV